MTQLLDTSKVEDVTIQAVTFIDDIVGLGEKRLSIDEKHFDEIKLGEDRIVMKINRSSLKEYTEERNKTLLEYENYPEFDHLNTMVTMLEYDFFSIDKVKFYYINDDQLSGEAVIDTSDDELVEMMSEIKDQQLILTIQVI